MFLVPMCVEWLSGRNDMVFSPSSVVDGVRLLQICGGVKKVGGGLYEVLHL